MTHFVDLANCDYFGGKQLSLVAVGWLENGNEFVVGTTPDAVVHRLAELLAFPWQPVAMAGWHDCSFCGRRSPKHVTVAERRIRVGISNVFVPGNDRVYVAPSLILHYILEHRYAPPLEFQDAVLRCPDMGSEDYMSALAQHDLRGLS